MENNFNKKFTPSNNQNVTDHRSSCGTPPPTDNDSENRKKHWYQNVALIIVLCFLFPPIGVSLLWEQKKDMTLAAKNTLSILGAIFFAIVYLAGQGGNQIESLNSTSNTAVVDSRTEATTKATTTKKSTASTTKKETSTTKAPETTKATETTTTAPSTTQAPTTAPPTTTTPPTTKAPTTAPPTTTAPPAVAAESEAGKVWISESGTKYHSRSSCSNMKNPRLVTIDEAVAAGHAEPCKKCY